MPNFAGFPPEYFVSTSSDEPLLINDVKVLTRGIRDGARKLYKGRPRHWISNFNLKNMPHVMVQIMAFAHIAKSDFDSVDGQEKQCRAYIKNKIARELRKHKDDDLQKDYHTVDGRLEVLATSIEDLELMEGLVHEAKSGGRINYKYWDFIQAYLNRLEMLRAELMTVQKMFWSCKLEHQIRLALQNLEPHIFQDPGSFPPRNTSLTRPELMTVDSVLHRL